MTRTLAAFLLLLFAAPALAADQARDDPAKEVQDKDSAPDPKAPPALDVSKMPFSPDSVREVMNHHQPKIQACYEDLLASREKVVEGRIMTAFTVTKEGLVRKPRILRKGTTLRNRRLHDCVIAVLASMNFPRPDRPQPIKYPLNLKAIE